MDDFDPSKSTADAALHGFLRRELIDRKALAMLLGITTQTLCVWHRQGRGPKAIRIGHQFRYRVGDIRDWLSAQEVTPATAA